MKRLLAYLFIVLGLGLVFSVNANSYEIGYCVKIKEDATWPFYLDTKRVDCPRGMKKVKWSTSKFKQFKQKIDDKYVPKTIASQSSAEGSACVMPSTSGYIIVVDTRWARSCRYPNLIHKTKFPAQYEKLKKYFREKKIDKGYHTGAIVNKNDLLLMIDGTQFYKIVAKKEPSQTQDVAKKKDDKRIIYCIAEHKAFNTQYFTTTWPPCSKGYKQVGLEKYNKFIKGDETQTAKAEPSQTQEVAKEKKSKLKNCINNNFHNCYGAWTYDNGVKYVGEWKNGKHYGQGTANWTNGETYTGEWKDHKKHGQGYATTKGWPNAKAKKLIGEWVNGKLIGEVEIVNSSGMQIGIALFEDDKFVKYIKSSKTKDKKVVKKEKKKKKVAKVVEQEQEEFKPEDKDIDNDPPVIEIAEAITVDSQAYTLKGKVKDKSKIYLTIDGRQVQVKKGKFKVDRFNIDPEEVEEIKIVAIDKWNNKSEKTIKVTIDLKSTELVRSFEDLKPNSVRVKTDKNKIAIIIGIEKYANLINLDAKYANRDAKAFRTYATQALGVKASNIKILVDDKATRSQTLKAFKLWLPRIAGDGGKDIHIFFAGHGLASDDGEDLYILPQDGESSLLEDTAISRVELISLVQKVNPKSVTMFFDTCYSGQTRDERMLVASLRPIRIVADEQDTPNNFTIFTASNYDQTSGSIEEAKHGMFSYYLMKGLEGKADNNKDKKITNGELIAYLKTNVSKEAFTQNREQDPMLSGNPNQVLMRYR